MGLSGPGLTLLRYGRALQVLHSVRAGWEPGLDAMLPGERGAHLSWLDADLRHLGLRPLAPAETVGVGDVGGAWGVRYVLEGSALGGQVLVREAGALGMGAAAGARYFAGSGRETGARWSGFLARMESAPVGGAAVVAGAVAAFEGLIRVGRAAQGG